MLHAFEHACRRCARPFSPQLNLTSYSILTADCPHCGMSHGYDNREGKLTKLLTAKVASLRNEQRGIPQTHRVHTLPPVTQTSTQNFQAPAPPPPLEQNASLYENSLSSQTEQREVYTKTKLPTWPQLKEKLLTLKENLTFSKPNNAWAKLLFSGVAFLFILGFTLFIWQAIPASNDEAKEAVRLLKARQTDVVLDRSGHELTKLGVSQSDKITLSAFQPWQIQALLYSEDRGFYKHHGVEYTAIARAFLNNLLRLRYAQGASTITQQLARIMLQNREKSIFRKVREARLARALENVLTKKEILELYVNNVYLGHGTYSFASAAKFYFSKPVKDLSPNEFLAIVALIPSPERLSPIKNNARLQARMNALFEGMRSTGILSLSVHQWNQAMVSVSEQKERFASETAFGEKSRLGLWPAEYAREFLSQRNILSSESQGSAKVYTTIDAAMQRRAEELLHTHLVSARKRFHGRIRSSDGASVRLKNSVRHAAFDAGLLLDLGGFTPVTNAEPLLQAALIAIKPTTGEILAMVGGDGFESNNQLNRTVKMRRQTGSAIKPFIYAKALSTHQINPATLIDDSPYIAGSGSRTWAPENINGDFEGPITARTALAKSRNIPAIRVGRLLGRDAVTELFYDFFFQDETQQSERFAYDETVAIGTISLSPLEMARAFSVFANQGYLNNPVLLTRLETPDRVIDLKNTHAHQLGLKQAPKERLLSAAETELMISLLKSSGSFSGTSLAGVIGKTGTTSNSRDLWFVGGGKDVIVAVWFGYDDMRYSIPGATGSALASKLAADFLRKDFAPIPFKMKPGMVRLRVCPLSGKLASSTCSHAQSEVFISGVVPQGECLHGKAVDLENDFVAIMGDSQFH
ncbi:MAG TPA: transglycosylase domain-containing protein [Turneriella sp.]|nr:transglycosylase domain-containing protein [Turneriella sp.]